MAEVEAQSERTSEPLTYGSYLRVPDLLMLQNPLSEPAVHDEMLFIVLQQAQELWFKQVLYELREVVDALGRGALLEATRLLERVNRILGVLSEEVEVMESLRPIEFVQFRHVLKSSSGFESEQFRELELASGLEDEHYLRMASKFVDMESYRARWPTTLRTAFLEILKAADPEPVQALLKIYGSPTEYPELGLLSEAFSEYEMRFGEWRFHHLKMVERIIGDRSPGTGGSAGTAYLNKTLAYRFFPELWEARNLLAGGSSPAVHAPADEGFPTEPAR